MEHLQNIKWYHITIVCLMAIILFLVFFGSNSAQNKCVTKPHSEEGFEEGKQEQKHDNVKGELILYYATWCGHSRNFLPEWEKFELHAKENMPFLKVDKIRCEDGHEATCQQKGVEGYPTVILYIKNGSEKLFEGQRTAEGLVNFINSNLH